MDKLKMHTPDLIEEKFRKLQELFPNAVTETLDANGNVRRAIDADILRQEIDVHVAEGREERYQFTWPEKAQSVLRACATTRKTLRLDRAKSVGRDGSQGSIDTENIYIEGDNLEALKILQETYLGKVKMIYIDPPYNTGNDFIYRDSFAESEDEYWEESGQLDEEGGRLVQNMESSGHFHTNWLNMIYPRLWLARDLLAQDGVIFISIDDNEAHNLRKCCDDVFGAGNFVGQIAWRRTDNQPNIGYLVRIKEYIVIYARSHKFSLGRLPLTDKARAEYRYSDEKGPFRRSILLHKTRGRKFYPKVTKLGNTLNGPWMVSEKEFDRMEANGEIYWTEGGDGQPYGKIYLSESKGQIPNDFWGIEFGTNQRGSLETEKLFGRRCFDFPKPVSLIGTLVKLGATDPDSLVLDFFSGSGTTAHAVMQLNAEDGGHRRFIMIQLPEECAAGSEAQKAGFANICEIGEERIRRAGRKTREEMAGKADALDTGFRVFYVDSSNMKDVWYTPEETAQDQLGSLVDNIKEDRTAEDLLFKAMLELGIELSASIAEEEIAGHRVFFVRDGALAACFDANIKEETLTEIAKRKPAFAVLRDSGLADDSAYVNFEQIFKAYSPNTRRRVI